MGICGEHVEGVTCLKVDAAAVVYGAQAVQHARPVGQRRIACGVALGIGQGMKVICLIGVVNMKCLDTVAECDQGVLHISAAKCAVSDVKAKTEDLCARHFIERVDIVVCLVRILAGALKDIAVSGVPHVFKADGDAMFLCGVDQLRIKIDITLAKLGGRIAEALGYGMDDDVAATEISCQLNASEVFKKAVLIFFILAITPNGEGGVSLADQETVAVKQFLVLFQNGFDDLLAALFKDSRLIAVFLGEIKEGIVKSVYAGFLIHLINRGSVSIGRSKARVDKTDLMHGNLSYLIK